MKTDFYKKSNAFIALFFMLASPAIVLAENPGKSQDISEMAIDVVLQQKKVSGVVVDKSGQPVT